MFIKAIAVASWQMHDRQRSIRGPGIRVNLDGLWRGGEGRARMAGLLISPGSWEAKANWAEGEDVSFYSWFIAQSSSVYIYLPTQACTMVSILHCGVMTAGCGTSLTGQADSGRYGAPPLLGCWDAGMADFMTEPSRGRRRAQTLRPTPEPLAAAVD